MPNSADPATADVAVEAKSKTATQLRSWIADRIPTGDQMVAFGTFLLAAATAWLAFIAGKTDEATHELAKHNGEQVKIIHEQLDAMKTANA